MAINSIPEHTCNFQLTKELYLALNEGLLFAHSMAQNHESGKAIPALATLWYEKHEPLLTQVLQAMGKSVA